MLKFLCAQITVMNKLFETRGRICKRLRSPGIDPEESIPPAYVASVLEFYNDLWGLRTE